MAPHYDDGGSSDDDEDFGPLLPGMHVHTSPPQERLDPSKAPPLKRERRDDTASGDSAIITTPFSPPPSPAQPQPSAEATLPSPTAAAEGAAPTTFTAADAHKDSAEETAWERYTRQQLPSAALYQRSFRHTSLQETYDALAAKTSTPAAHAVHDVCVHHDSLGALIATIDAAGVVRMWRKLPRGVFFVTELNKVFGGPRKSTMDVDDNGNQNGGDDDSGVRVHRSYWAHAYAALQLLVFACVEEDAVDARELTAQDVGRVSVPPAAQLRTVRVHLRQVNPVTFTVEEKHSFSFQVPLQAVPALDLVDVSLPPRTSSKADTVVAPFALAYTRCPAFITHQYTPYIAFFVSLPAATTPTSTTGSINATGGCGVVLCPCFPSLSAPVKDRTADAASPLANAACTLYTATRLSVANPVVRCVQQSLGLERSGTAPCVIIDASGIVDYCTMEATAPAKTGASATVVGLTLKVMAGLAAVPAASREGRLWRQWIRFDRRQRTGFFSLLRDAQQALRLASEGGDTHLPPIAGAAAPTDVQIIPAALDLTPDGRYVVVWSLRLGRCESAGGSTGATRSRIPTAQRQFTLTVESCLHVLEFESGACVGRQTETLVEDAVTSVEDIGVNAADWAAAVQLRSRSLAAQIQVVEGAAAAAASSSSSNTPRWYIMIPVVSAAHVLVGDGEAATTREDGSKSGHDDSGVCGRRVTVYEAAAAGEGSVTVRRLPHGPGEWEVLVHQDCTRGGPVPARQPQPTHLRIRLATFADAMSRLSASAGDGNASSLAAPQRLCRAPLLLLRRAVTPSQDLKNLIAASPVGAALGAESRKQLFLASGAGDGVEGLLLATSCETSAASLLVYGCALPYSGVAVQRLLLLPQRSQDGAPTAAQGELHDTAQQQQQQQEALMLWTKACQELHRERDYACGALLMTTVAPPANQTTSAAAAAVAGAGVPSSTTADAHEGREGQQEEKGEGSPTSGSTSVPARPTPGTTLAPSSPEAFVLRLLKDVVPELSAINNMVVTRKVRLPTALVHVRGYGTIRVHLLPHLAPLASENFIRLSRKHYYDRLTFHRVIPRVIVQGGCPCGDGTGGESAFEGGASFADEALDAFPFFLHTTEPKCCWLCMANAGPNTNGSQFFFTVPGGEAMPWLNGHHTVFGFAVEGLEVVRAMSVAARDADDKPLSPIVIERVDVLSG